MYIPLTAEESCMRVERLKHSFVDTVPPYDQMENDMIYVSLPCNVAIHKCACGCGKEVVTTIAPHRWKMIYDGKTVSLSPSIGNWYFACKSHYFIRENQVIWVETPSVQKRKPWTNWYWRFLSGFNRKR